MNNQQMQWTLAGVHNNNFSNAETPGMVASQDLLAKSNQSEFDALLLQTKNHQGYTWNNWGWITPVQPPFQYDPPARQNGMSVLLSKVSKWDLFSYIFGN